jgi:hypothetical protein
MRIYPLGNQWGLYVDGTETVLETRLEAENMATKVKFVEALRVQATALSDARMTLAELKKVYTDRKYENDNAITPEDVSPLGLTVAQVTAMITEVQGILTLLDSDDVRKALNDMRADV